MARSCGLQCCWSMLGSSVRRCIVWLGWAFGVCSCVRLVGCGVSSGRGGLLISMAFIPAFLAPWMSASGVSPMNMAFDGCTLRVWRAFWKILGLGLRLFMAAEMITVWKCRSILCCLSSLCAHSGMAKLETMPSLYFLLSLESTVFASGSRLVCFVNSLQKVFVALAIVGCSGGRLMLKFWSVWLILMLKGRCA